MKESNIVLLVWLGGAVVVVFVLIAVERMVHRGTSGHRTAATTRRRRWLLIPAVLVLAVYGAQFGMSGGRRELIPILALLLLALVALVVGNPFRTRSPGSEGKHEG
jgi:uncharacterized membrane protein YkvI